jgi:hypothetical protein
MPFQTRLHASQALDSDHLPVLMYNANRNSTVQITNWPRFGPVSPGAEPTELAAPLTERKQIASATIALIDHRNDRWERKLESLTTEDNSIWENGESAPLQQKAITTDSRYARTRFLGRRKSGGVG